MLAIFVKVRIKNPKDEKKSHKQETFYLSHSADRSTDNKKSNTIKKRKKKKKSHLSPVTCHLSPVTCHMSPTPPTTDPPHANSPTMNLSSSIEPRPRKLNILWQVPYFNSFPK